MAWNCRLFQAVWRSAAVAACILLLWRPSAAAQSASIINGTYFAPGTNVYINCGSTTNATVDVIGDFLADTNAAYVSRGHLASNSLPVNDTEDTKPQLLETARVFFNASGYTIPVTRGRLWLRLWFYPISFIVNGTTYDPSKARFTVTANNVTLLSNLTATTIRSARTTRYYMYREYLINAANSSSLSIEFAPDPRAFAFVNALQVKSAPDDLIDDMFTLVPGPGPLSVVSTDMYSNSLQTMYRLNVGGDPQPPINDPFLYRDWKGYDTTYLFASAGSTEVSVVNNSISYPDGVDSWIAPRSIYSTARTLGETGNRYSNLTWSFDVDPGFAYYLRLHFAEIVYSTAGQRVFDIFVNDVYSTAGYDCVKAAGGKANASSYQNYVVNMYDNASSTLWVTLKPNNGNSEFSDVILNGVEIFKVNNTASSLTGAAVVVASGGGRKSGLSTGAVVAVSVGGAVAVLAIAIVAAAVWFLCYTRQSRRAAPLALLNTISRRSSAPLSWSGSSSGRYFSLAELRAATNDFHHDNLLGVGGFGKVYKACIDGGTPVAVKRATSGSSQGIAEFQTEIQLLAKLRHRHLTSLIGHSQEKNEMLLVYEYMANGVLRDHLYGKTFNPLSWMQRLDICLGAARGIHYLHTGAAHGIIHRDVKTTNILLDEKFVAKVADFGLSKIGPAQSLGQTHVTTAVKGSLGYLDPEYFQRGKLTDKSDVYSFGVVLLEVVCARPVFNFTLSGEEMNLVEWALNRQRAGTLEQIMDPKLAGRVCPESLLKFGQTAERCLAEKGSNRPAMENVLWSLEEAMQLQKNWTGAGNGAAEEEMMVVNDGSEV